ncbi:MAG TPA: phenylalanine--tRNA ligase subunit alpha [Candidatus Peribacteraceae bacterium]|nr:phenylalanine--tRNA ligase subunit alpha [Candidatus Peribacteraceae bacterium]
MEHADINWQSYLDRIANANAADLDALEIELLGRKRGVLTDALKALGTLSIDEKKSKGAELNVWKKKMEDAIAERRAQLTGATLSSLAETDAIDPTLNLPESMQGHLHLIPEFIRQIEDVFGRMGFDVARGNEVESEQENFTLLNIPADHPARDMQATFWIKDMPNHVLRTHTSPVQIHYMKSHTPPFRMICPGKVYRKDADATHSPMFHQFEGLMIGENISVANMKAVMVSALKELINENIEFRFRTSYFPFTEPSLEIDMRWLNKKGEQTSGRWLEVGGCGMVHPNVLKNVGIDPNLWNGFAFGFGIERLIMIKHQMKGLRMFYEGDLRFLEQF